MPDMDYFLWSSLLAFCALIFLYDYLFRRVPNKLLLAAIVLQLGCLLLQSRGISGVGWRSATAGFFLGLAFFLPLYVLRAMAAGDVKFFAVLGFLLGPTALLPIFLIASLMAAAHAVVLYVSRLGIIPGLQLVTMQAARCSLYQRILEKRGDRVGIPYAAYLAVAGVWVEIHGAGAMPGFT